MFLVEEYLRFYRFSLPAPCRIRLVHNNSKRQLSFLPSTGYSKRSKTTHSSRLETITIPRRKKISMPHSCAILGSQRRSEMSLSNLAAPHNRILLTDLNGQQVSYADLRNVW